MAHGSPDHVGMTDINLLDYVDKTNNQATEIIGTGEAYEVINAVGVGCFGSFMYKVDNRFTSMRLTVNDLQIETFQMIVMWEILKQGGNAGYPNVGVTCYDRVNDLYAMWIDFNWQLSFKKSLLLEIINNSAADITCKYIKSFWKEKR